MIMMHNILLNIGYKERDLNIHLYLTLNYVTLQNTWNIVHGNFMVFYNVFVTFVELKNNTIVALQNIKFGSVSSDRYPDPEENASFEVVPILYIGSAHP